MEVVPDRAVLPTCGRFANQSLLQSDGSITRVQRAETLGPVSQITRQNARAILQSRVDKQNQIQRQPKAIMKLSDFVTKEWWPNAGLALKESSVRYYDHLLERHILPAYGSHPLSELNRAGIESILANLRQKGHASGTLRGVRATFDGPQDRRGTGLSRKKRCSRHSHSQYGCEEGATPLFTRPGSAVVASFDRTVPNRGTHRSADGFAHRGDSRLKVEEDRPLAQDA